MHHLKLWKQFSEPSLIFNRLHFKRVRPDGAKEDATEGSDEEYCSSFPVTYLTAVYGGYGHFAPCRRNSATVKSDRVKVDGRGVSVKMRLGLYMKNLTWDPSECEVDPIKMKYDPVKIRFHHLDKSTSRRKLLMEWAEEKIQSDVKIYSCRCYSCSCCCCCCFFVHLANTSAKKQQRNTW